MKLHAFLKELSSNILSYFELVVYKTTFKLK